MIVLPELSVAKRIAHFTSRPPVSLAGVRCRAARLPGYPFDGSRESVYVLFAIACPCEGIEFFVLAHDGKDGLESPLKLTCTECGASSVVFDARRHGHDGALGLHAKKAAPRGPLVHVYGRGVQGPYAVFIRLEYPTNIPGDGAPFDWKGRESELFSRITFVGRDGETDTLATLFDHACG